MYIYYTSTRIKSKNEIETISLFLLLSIINELDYKWTRIINELEFEDKKLTDPTEIAEGFNKFFAEIGPKLSENIEDIDNCFDKFVNESIRATLVFSK